MARHFGKDRQLFSHIRPKSAIAESFRTLRTNLTFSAHTGKNRTILITSPNPEDGKSTVTSNLGVVLAQAGSRVLIVDCDLRKPVMHSCFNLNKASGLTNVLAQDLNPDDVVSKTEVEGLYVMASGPIPPNPSELLGSAKMVDFLARISEQYDVVLLDAPPAIVVTDAVLLAPMVDSVLLVLKAGSSRIELAREARDRLVNANAKSIGVVLNEAGTGNSNYSYYYGSEEKTVHRKKVSNETAHVIS